MSNQSPILALSFALDVVRKVDPYMPVQHLLALLVIARKPGCSPGDIVTSLETSSASAARIVAKLSDWEIPGKPGYKLIHVEIDMTDRRRRLLWLTPAGQKFIKKIEEVLS